MIIQGYSLLFFNFFMVNTYNKHITISPKKDPKQGYRMNSHWPNGSVIPCLPLSSASHSPKQTIVHIILIFTSLHWHKTGYSKSSLLDLRLLRKWIQDAEKATLLLSAAVSLLMVSLCFSAVEFSLSLVMFSIDCSLSWQTARDNKISFSRKEKQLKKSLFSRQMWKLFPLIWAFYKAKVVGGGVKKEKRVGREDKREVKKRKGKQKEKQKGKQKKKKKKDGK